MQRTLVGALALGLSMFLVGCGGGGNEKPKVNITVKDAKIEIKDMPKIEIKDGFPKIEIKDGFPKIEIKDAPKIEIPKIEIK